jgi:hypothetical protein
LSRFLALFGSAVLGWSLLGACGSSTDDDTGSAGTGAGGSGGADATVGGAGGTGGVDIDANDAPFPDTGCTGDSQKAQPIPLDIFVMLDQSGSMDLDAGNLLSRWDTVKQAISQFVKLPDSAGIGIGIQYFGLPDPSPHGCITQTCGTDTDCTGGCTTCMPQGLCQAPFNPDIDSCEAIDYAWAEVPIQPLPGVGNFIVGSMSAHTPGTNTPTLPALEGAIIYAKAWANAHPDRITVVTLATDGEPSECETDPAVINGIAKAGFDQAPSIQTFVIGVGAAVTALDDVAFNGGTDKAFHVDFDPNATDLFLQAMNTIRLSALNCTYELPEPPPGKQLNLDQVNVGYTPGDGSPLLKLPKVDNSAACGDEDGWYYDDNANPTKITLCKSTCKKLKADLQGQVDIIVGCATILK